MDENEVERISYEIQIKRKGYSLSCKIIAWRKLPRQCGRQRVYHTTIKRLQQLRDESTFIQEKAPSAEIWSCWWIFDARGEPDDREIVLDLEVKRPMKSYHRRQT